MSWAEFRSDEAILEMVAPGRTMMLLQLLLLAIVLAVSRAPAWAAGEPHYIVQLSLQPAMRELHVRMSVSLPAGAERRFGLDRGFAVKTMAIDGRTVDPRQPGPCRRVALSKSCIPPRCQA